MPRQPRSVRIMLTMPRMHDLVRVGAQRVYDAYGPPPEERDVGGAPSQAPSLDEVMSDDEASAGAADASASESAAEAAEAHESLNAALHRSNASLGARLRLAIVEERMQRNLVSGRRAGLRCEAELRPSLASLSGRADSSRR